MSRIPLTFLVIFSLIACPFWCVEGSSCCVGDHLSKTVGSEKPCCEHCHHEEQLPLDAPCEHDYSCQGVCGGVILGDPVVITDVTPELDHLLAIARLCTIRLLSVTLQFEGESIGALDDHSGRGLRTLFCSYLC